MFDKAVQFTLLSASILPAMYSFAGGQPVYNLATITVQTNQDQDKEKGLSATQGIVTKKQLETRPLLRPAEVLETIPGLIVTQHSGDGKANQYFLRGFNLDHGTDFATSVDGIPINMVTHAHGQGYTDLNFLIPELIDSIQYHKGALEVTDGDFASAGSAQIHTIAAVERPFIQLTAGSNQYRRILAVTSMTLWDGTLLAALEGMTNDGPWDTAENLKKQNYFFKYSQGDQKNGWNISLNHYQSDWNSTDQVAQRAIESGLISRYGSLNSTDGGKTARTALSFEGKTTDANRTTQYTLYAVHSKLNLFSDFTYYLDDPVVGDQFEQAEQRNYFGGKINRDWAFQGFDKEMVNSLGASVRYDVINGLGLYQTEARQRLNTIRLDDVKEQSMGIWAQNKTQWMPWLRSIAGVRADYFHFDVDSNLAENSGTANAGMVSPKFGLVFGPWANTEYYVNYAYGFHSNDARGTTIKINPDPRDADYLQAIASVSPLVRTKNMEFGIRGQWFANLTSSIALWRLDSDSELVFVGDAGTTEASRPSQRQGIEISHFYQPNQDWIIDVDFAASKARYKDSAPEGNYIPGAIGTTASAGISYNPSHSSFSTGLRWRYFGSRPLIEDNSVQSSSSSLLNMQAAYQFSPRVKGQLDILNLLNKKVNDIEYLYESCLASELTTVECATTSSDRTGILDKHVHPAEPRSFRVSLSYFF